MRHKKTIIMALLLIGATIGGYYLYIEVTMGAVIHEHYTISIFIMDLNIPFEDPAFMYTSPYIHFEPVQVTKDNHYVYNNKILHIHRENADIIYFLKSLGFYINDKCIKPNKTIRDYYSNFVKDHPLKNARKLAPELEDKCYDYRIYFNGNIMYHSRPLKPGEGYYIDDPHYIIFIEEKQQEQQTKNN